MPARDGLDLVRALLSLALAHLPLSPRKIEDALQIGHGTLPRLLDGRMDLKLCHLLPLCAVLEIHPAELLFRTTPDFSGPHGTFPDGKVGGSPEMSRSAAEPGRQPLGEDAHLRSVRLRGPDQVARFGEPRGELGAEAAEPPNLLGVLGRARSSGSRWRVVASIGRLAEDLRHSDPKPSDDFPVASHRERASHSRRRAAGGKLWWKCFSMGQEEQSTTGR